MYGVGKRNEKARGFTRWAIIRVAFCLAILLSTCIVIVLQRDVSAAPTSTPNCVSGVGIGGTDSATASSARGGNGCVVIQFVDGGSLQFETFNFTGADQSWTVPVGVSSVVFHVLGGGGGGGRVGSGANGGGGGYATGTYAVTAGQVLVVIVGEGGARQSPADVAALTTATARRNVSFGGGASGQGVSGYGESFGSGGGRSAIRLTGSVEDLVTAGGGGGGGYTSAGGAGGGFAGQDGGGSAGRGGTQVAGGATSFPEPGVAGIKYAGGYAGTVLSGNEPSEGGGGGGGFYGGGGAGDNGGGGGGSSYTSLLTNGSTIAGIWRQPGVQSPLNTSAPNVTGTSVIAGTLTATSGTWASAATQTWQWQYSSDGVNFTNMVGATSVSYSPTQVGSYRVVETHSNIFGSVSSASTVQVVQAPVVPPQSTTIVPSTSSTTTSAPTTTSTTTSTTSTTTTTTTTTTTLPNSKIPYTTSEMEKVENGVALVAGLPSGGWITAVPNSTGYQITTSDGLRIAIGAEQVATQSSPFNSRGMLIFETGDEITIAGEGLMPNSPASTWMFSTPTELGQMMVNADGSFNEKYVVSASIQPGDHTAQLNGIAPDGTLRVVEVKVEVIEDAVAENNELAGVGKTTGVPSTPPLDTNALLGLAVSAFALLALNRRTLSALPAVETSSENKEETGREEAGGDLASVEAGFGRNAHTAIEDRIRPPHVFRIDNAIKKIALWCDRQSPMLARIADDGSYARSLFGIGWVLLPIAGVITGVASVFNTDFIVMIPSLALVTVALVIGGLDAASGFAFTVAYGITMLLGGGFSSVNSVRGFFGLAIMSFAPALIASAVRPFRRISVGVDDMWNRINDFVLITLFGAWATGSMYSALPSLTTYKPDHSDRTDYIQLVMLLVLACRWILENGARTLTPLRLGKVEVGEFDEPSQTQQLVSYVLRTALFVFVAVVFIGNTWALWVGAAMFLVPKIIKHFSDTFPNVPFLHRYVPRKLFRTVVMLFVGMWWSTLIQSRFGDSSDSVLYGFVLLGIPGLVLGVVDMFGRDGKKWQSTPLSKSLGVVVLIIGVLTVRGYIP